MPAAFDNDRRDCPIISSTPTAVRVLGAVFLALCVVWSCLLVWMLVAGLPRTRPDKMTEVALVALFMLVITGVIAVACVHMVLKPGIIVAFDATTRTATLSRRNLLGQQWEAFAFDEIAAIGQRQLEEEDGSASQSFHAVMYLRDGREIGLTAGAVRYAEHEATLARIRHVTGAAERDTLVAAGA